LAKRRRVETKFPHPYHPELTVTLQRVPVFKAGEFGEHPYAVDLLHGVAKCTLKPFTECLVRRMPVKY